jgi:hypothetical protein
MELAKGSTNNAATYCQQRIRDSIKVENGAVLIMLIMGNIDEGGVPRINSLPILTCDPIRLD